jgi:hypothetical protein
METRRAVKTAQELLETAAYWRALADKAEAPELAAEMRWIAENYQELAQRAAGLEEAAVA